MYIIYQITNKVNNKNYIGLTKGTIEKRWYKHKWDAKNTKTQRSTHFQKAIKKYEDINWAIAIICCCINKEYAEEMERYFIKQYDSYKNGYNMTEGGSAFGGLCGEHNGMHGRTHTRKVKDKLSKNATERFSNKSYEDMYGIEKSNELKRKRSLATEKRKVNTPFTGSNNSMFDNNIYTFIHKNGDIFIGMQSDFITRFHLNKTCVSELIHKKQKTTQGWSFISCSQR